MRKFQPNWTAHGWEIQIFVRDRLQQTDYNRQNTDSNHIKAKSLKVAADKNKTCMLMWDTNKFQLNRSVQCWEITFFVRTRLQQTDLNLRRQVKPYTAAWTAAYAATKVAADWKKLKIISPQVYPDYRLWRYPSNIIFFLFPIIVT
jgi:hypothetical protein